MQVSVGRTGWYWLERSFVVVAAAALMAGCAESSPLGPDRSSALPGQGGAAPVAVSVGAAPDLGSCAIVKAPEGSTFAFHAFARGVQMYHWNGSTWSFDGPSAELFADAEGTARVGTHYAGPTWESISGSTVKGTISQRCTADPNSIQWLLLQAVSSGGPGVFDGMAFIQRVNTVGGNAPSYNGSFIGEAANVEYTAEYFFYRAQ